MKIVKETGEVRIVANRDGRFYVSVQDDDTWRTATAADTYEDARPFANVAHNVFRRGGDAADAIVAVITVRAEQTCRQYVGYDMGEAVWNGVNTHLGLCSDGCCGGAEILPEEEIPGWVAYRKRLADAVNRSNVIA